MLWEFTKAKFPADAVGIQHHFLLVLREFMKAFPADAVGIHESIQSNIIPADEVRIHVDARECKTCHCQNFCFVLLLKLLVCFVPQEFGALLPAKEVSAVSQDDVCGEICALQASVA
jgi:hypothetical protein